MWFRLSKCVSYFLLVKKLSRNFSKFGSVKYFCVENDCNFEEHLLSASENDITNRKVNVIETVCGNASFSRLDLKSSTQILSNRSKVDLLIIA